MRILQMVPHRGQYTLILQNPQYSLPPQRYVRNRDQPWVVDGTFLTPDVNGCVYDGR